MKPIRYGMILNISTSKNDLIENLDKVILLQKLETDSSDHVSYILYKDSDYDSYNGSEGIVDKLKDECYKYVKSHIFNSEICEILINTYVFLSTKIKESNFSIFGKNIEVCSKNSNDASITILVEPVMRGLKEGIIIK